MDETTSIPEPTGSSSTINEECPLCKLILAGKIIQRGEYCFKVKLEDRVLVVDRIHNLNRATNDGYIEACTMLLAKAPPNGIIREVVEWPGHWAMELQLLTEGAGKSVVGS